MARCCDGSSLTLPEKDVLNAVYRIDDETLREVLDDPAAAAERVRNLETPPHADDPRALGERVALLRMLGRLAEAEELANRALRLPGLDERRRVAAATRLAHVLHWQGRYAEADALFRQAIEAAGKLGNPVLLAFAHQHLGKLLFDQGRFAAAAECFGTALRLRLDAGAAQDQIASSRQALAVVTRQMADADQAQPGT